MILDPTGVPLALQTSPREDDCWRESPALSGDSFNNSDLVCAVRSRNDSPVGKGAPYNGTGASLNLLYAVFVHICDVTGGDLLGVDLSA